MKLLITGGIKLGGKSYQAGDVLECDGAKAKEYLGFTKVTIAPVDPDPVQQVQEMEKPKTKRRAK